jgi:DNA invertase Pin-like site-specific DNA recombinase
MAHGVPFVVAELGLDVPPFILHIYASFAQLEREQIGKRVKEALKQAKKRGVKLGTSVPAVKEACREANIRRGNKSFEAILPHIQEAQEQGFTSTRKIALFLNDKGMKTPRGKSWTSKQISRILIKMNGRQCELDFSQGQ